MISNVVERYCHMISHDTLVCEFHQVMQRKMNTLRNFLEVLRKCLKNYKGKYLKDILFQKTACLTECINNSLRLLVVFVHSNISDLCKFITSSKCHWSRGRKRSTVQSKVTNITAIPQKIALWRSRSSPAGSCCYVTMSTS